MSFERRLFYRGMKKRAPTIQRHDTGQTEFLMGRSVIHGSTKSIVYDRGAGPWTPSKLFYGGWSMLLHSVKWNIKVEMRIKRTRVARSRENFNSRYFSFCALSILLTLNFSFQKTFEKRTTPKTIATCVLINLIRQDEAFHLNYYSFQFFFARFFLHTSSTKPCGKLKCSLISQ